jgi:tripeptide aminopeptidase
MNLIDLLEKYNPSYREELEFKERMLAFAKRHKDCFERSLEEGHFTASCWLLDQSGEKALLMHHAKLDMWLQLGGHADGKSDLLKVALKEAEEESGLSCIKPLSPAVFDIDIHFIPDNGKEKGHYHYDVRFLLQAEGNKEVRINSESKQLLWIDKNPENLPTNNPAVVRMFKKWSEVMKIAIDQEDLLQRFLRYVQIDTQSDCHSSSCPSTEKQWELIRLLEKELKGFGLKDTRVTEFGYVLATVPSNSKKKSVPQVAFLAHVDTADACPGGAKPIVHRGYNGKPITLPDDPTQVLTVEEIPLLKEKIGEDIITASGKTLLGADDKAGVAIIMSTVKYLVEHPEIIHGPIRICFNPDEEIGRGMHKIEFSDLGAKAAYTLDSEHVGEIDFETFSADQATVVIKGVAAHPGAAKGVMVNALRLASLFIHKLPKKLSPEETSDREGFIHPVEVTGTAEKASIRLILRDFELEGLEAKKHFLQTLVKELETKEPRAKWDLCITPQYRNMRYWLDKEVFVVDAAKEAIRRAGLEPISESVRGGTDGSHLTERGIPTPNLFTGFHNIHSPKEWVSLQDMVLSATTLIHLSQIWEENA